MNPSHLEHSKADIIWSALAYQYTVPSLIKDSQAIAVREKVNALFSDIGPSLQHVHTDSRRSIHEYNWSDFSIQWFEVHSADVPLGNHFHRKSVWHVGSNWTDLWQLSEMFIFDEWKGLLLLQQLDPEWNIVGRMKEFSILARDIIVIPPFIAHTLYLKSDTKFRWFRPYPFDKNNMDMNPYKLELQR